MVRLYQSRTKTVATVRVTARIVDGEERTAFATETTLAPDAFSAQKYADYRLDVPLDRLTAGEYLMILDASTGTTSARRELRFVVGR